MSLGIDGSFEDETFMMRALSLYDKLLLIRSNLQSFVFGSFILETTSISNFQ